MGPGKKSLRRPSRSNHYKLLKETSLCFVCVRESRAADQTLIQEKRTPLSVHKGGSGRRDQDGARLIKFKNRGGKPTLWLERKNPIRRNAKTEGIVVRRGGDGVNKRLQNHVGIVDINCLREKAGNPEGVEKNANWGTPFAAVNVPRSKRKDEVGSPESGGGKF